MTRDPFITKPQPGLFALLADDLRAKARWCYGTTTRQSLFKVLATDGTWAMIYYRLMQWSTAHRIVPLAMIFNKLNGVLCQCVIGRGAQFGPRFVIIHSQGIVINSRVRAGCDVFLEHQVTIGEEQGKCPRLGNDVFVGAGAKVFGDVTIGDHVKIGANAVVCRDVPDDSTAVGVPARNISRKRSNAFETSDDCDIDDHARQERAL